MCTRCGAPPGSISWRKRAVVNSDEHCQILCWTIDRCMSPWFVGSGVMYPEAKGIKALQRDVLMVWHLHTHTDDKRQHIHAPACLHITCTYSVFLHTDSFIVPIQKIHKHNLPWYSRLTIVTLPHAPLVHDSSTNTLQSAHSQSRQAGDHPHPHLSHRNHISATWGPCLHQACAAWV